MHNVDKWRVQTSHQQTNIVSSNDESQTNYHIKKQIKKKRQDVFNELLYTAYGADPNAVFDAEQYGRLFTTFQVR